MTTLMVTVSFLMVFIASRFDCKIQVTCPKMCSCEEDTRYPSEGSNINIKVNCNNRGLSALPGDIPSRTTTLLFALNSLTHLQNCTFCHLKALKSLDLSSNRISLLEEGSFEELTNLQDLRLNQNQLQLSPHTFPRFIFRPLTSLRFLFLHNNTHLASKKSDHSEQHAFDSSSLSSPLSPRTAREQNRTISLKVTENKLDEISKRAGRILSLDYPDIALSSLSNLEKLSLDGLTNKSFGPGFKQLDNLRKLVISGKSGFCKIDTLTNKTFANIPSLEDLDLSECGINTIQADSFGALPNLVNLSLSCNSHLGLNTLGDAFYGLTRTKLTTLFVDGIVPFGSPGQTITKKIMRFFRNLTHLRNITARFNKIVKFEEGALCSGVPPSLTTVYLGCNWLELTYYIKDLHCLKGLEVLSIDGLDYEAPRLRLPDVTPRLDRMESHHSWSAPQIVPDKSCRVNNPQEFVLPQNLKNLSVANMGLFYVLGEIRVHPSNSLERLEASGNSFLAWYGPVAGLNKLTTLNLAHSLGTEITPQFFESFPSLKVLTISGNKFGEAIRADTEGRLFRGLRNLEELNLSKNDIGYLHSNFFYGLNNLQKLNLSKNGLGTFNVSLTHMKNLSFLDLNKNLLNFLPQSLREHLDSLAETHPVTVNMTYNPISCTCFNIEFLRWVVESKIQFGADENYYCLHEDGSQTLVSTLALKSAIKHLEQTCGGNVGAFFASGALFLSLMTSVALALAYRFRWKLRYLYYATRLNFQRQRQSADDEFDFDAFVSFSSEDNDFVMGELRRRLEDDRDVTLCIHTRDFMPGQYIATNVVDCVQRSRRTLVVVTRALLESDWCHYELQMALMEASHTGRHVLVFLLYEHLSSHEIPRQVLYNIQAATHIEFPHEEEDTNLFWNRLTLALKARCFT